MRTPQKASLIYRQLRSEIFQRKYKSGDMLPKELELASQLNVSRVTIRNAFKMLEEEQLIRRVSGCGTFVSDTIKRPKIVFLLPCADQKISEIPFVSDIFQGILQGVLEFNCELEALPVSPTNDPENIDLSRFFNLNSESRVIVSGTWFKKLFPVLKACKCQVAVIMDESPLELSKSLEYRDWLWLAKDTHDVDQRMCEELYLRGCRKPLFLLKYLEDPTAYLKEDIIKFGTKFWPEKKPIIVPVKHLGFFALDVQALINEIFAQQDFDGVLVNDVQIFKALRKYNSTIECGFFDLLQFPQIRADEHTFYSEFPLIEMGKNAVEELIKSDHSGKVLRYTAEICTQHGE